MSKIKCLCGHLIVDQTDSLSYKAHFFADEDYEAAYGKFITFCAQFIEATDKGKLAEFIRHQFGEAYPQEGLSTEDFISDSLAGLLAIFGHPLYECVQCGRLWVKPI